MKVALVGPTGETGISIVNGHNCPYSTELAPETRSSCFRKERRRNCRNRPQQPEDEVTKQLTGCEVVISAIVAEKLLDQIPLANAAKKAGVKRFVLYFFGTVMPSRGMLGFRDQKEDVLNHVQTLYLPYTVIDVGWWYQISPPRLPSGKVDAIASRFEDWIAGDGTVLSGMTDLRDIGKYVARIVADHRTLNHKVFAYTELRSQNEVYDLIEKLSGEKLQRKYVSLRSPAQAIEGFDLERSLSAKEIDAQLEEARGDKANIHKLSVLQYRKSSGLRGDNTPEYARYLGYQIAKDLYPDLTGNSFENFCKEALKGKKREAVAAAAQNKTAEN
ncbi:isoflavone reductase family protein [Colletotrichum incanum]|nr:isoflavone reductase family protein [Colletotrichum incanum]